MITKVNLIKDQPIQALEQVEELLNNFIELNAIAGFMVETNMAMPAEQVANFQIRMHELNEAIEASPIMEKAKKEFLVLSAIKEDRK